MHEELKEKLRQIDNNYDGKAFQAIINKVKKDKVSDEEILNLIEKISQKRFRERVSFNFSVFGGNMLEIIVTAAAIALVFQAGADWMLYIGALVLMTTLHPLSHYITGSLVGIKFTHYYLNGPARIEPTLRINYSTYLKAPAGSRALMHMSGVIGTVAAPLILALIAISKGASGAAVNLGILFLLLIVFELLTSTKIGDLMRAKREYGFK
ncbi:MAG: hypothetical protein FIB08_06280 [Candidatus Methanoperedens sp.]|nr:hypothetical protein [Candidatus Methanoperedens sp.]